MAAKRMKRPKPERQRPVRGWKTLFTPPAGAVPASADEAVNRQNASGAGSALPETVELGYRVIDEYLRQGQKLAQAFSPGAWTNPTAGPDELQQLTQRVMQYGWDFVGVWFEMWTKMGNGGLPTVPGRESTAPQPNPSTPAPTAGASEMKSTPERIAVSVVSNRPTETSVELQAGCGSNLLIHTLRPEGHDGPPIKDVTLARGSDETVRLRVVVRPDHPTGIYNGMIIDGTTNLPRGTLSVRILSQA